MKRERVSFSTNIWAVGYDFSSQILEVEFHNGGVYQYKNVPFGKYHGLMGASSKGGYLAREIKPYYPYRKVGEKAA